MIPLRCNPVCIYMCDPAFIHLMLSVLALVRIIETLVIHSSKQKRLESVLVGYDTVLIKSTKCVPKNFKLNSMALALDRKSLKLYGCLSV